MISSLIVEKEPFYTYATMWSSKRCLTTETFTLLCVACLECTADMSQIPCQIKEVIVSYYILMEQGKATIQVSAQLVN
jgi:hypothetical protein